MHINMNKNNLLSSLVLSFMLIWTSSAFSQKVGIFDGHTDVGTNVKPGSATFIPETRQYVISGAGYNVWGDHDEFQVVWKKMKGDFILYTKAEFLGKPGGTLKVLAYIYGGQGSINTPS